MTGAPTGVVCGDSSAALAISNRLGCGKLHHINIGQLWIQERVKEGDLTVQKVLVTDNPAGLFTKHPNAAKRDHCCGNRATNGDGAGLVRPAGACQQSKTPSTVVTIEQRQNSLLYDAIPEQYIDKVMITQFRDSDDILVEERIDPVVLGSRYKAMLKNNDARWSTIRSIICMVDNEIVRRVHLRDSRGMLGYEANPGAPSGLAVSGVPTMSLLLSETERCLNTQ